MTKRPLLERRPWITASSVYDRITAPGVLHYDLLAFRDRLGRVVFIVEARARGKKPLRGGAYLWDGLCGVNMSVPETLADMVPLYWTRETNHIFRLVHRALLNECTLFPGYNVTSIHCHYVPTPDADPWPSRRDWNHWRQDVHGRRGRPRKIREHVAPTDEAARLPNWL